jgi:hypothetical protein
MIRHALDRNLDQHRLGYERITLSKRLNRLAASPWALSCTSFVVTALLIRSNGLSVF